MKSNRFVIILLVILSLTLGYLAFEVLRPFLNAFAWAVALTIVFYPVYVYISKRTRWNSLASVITTTIVLLVMLGPFSYITFLIIQELRDVAAYLDAGELGDLDSLINHPRAEWLVNRLTAMFDIEKEAIGALIVESLSDVRKNALTHLTVGAKNAVKLIIDFAVMTFSLFFLFRDGSEILKGVHAYLPFSEEQKQKIEQRMKDIVISTIFGGVVVALVQGTMGGITFYLLDIKSPALWGMAIAVMSFVPFMGAFSVWGSIAAYLFIKGLWVKGLILCAVGLFGISTIDNILKPMIVSDRTKMPTLLIFFCILGGLKLFGPIGLIAGPMVLAMFVSVLDIFRKLEAPRVGFSPEDL